MTGVILGVFNHGHHLEISAFVGDKGGIDEVALVVE